MATTVTKKHYPTGSDVFVPHQDMRALAESATGVIVPVADRSEADAIRGSFGPSPQKPLYVDRADAGVIERHNGQKWQLIGLGEENLFTPVLDTANDDLSLGSTGVAEGMWVRVGRMVHAWGRFQAGGTGVRVGTGSIRMHLPMPALDEFYNVSANLGAGPPLGHGRMRPASGGPYNLYIQIDANTGLPFFGVDGRTSALNATDLEGGNNAFALAFSLSYYTEPL